MWSKELGSFVYKLKDTKEKLLFELLQLGVDEQEARCQAGLIIEHATGLKLSDQLLKESEELDSQASLVIENLLGRRKQREPLQYCLGYAYFMGFKFKIRQGVFIPRSDTETLANCAISLLKQKINPLVCEIGVGSGAVSISILKANPKVQLVAIDSSPEAALLTRENAKEHDVLDRLQIIISDWQTALPSNLDAIVSNPPYIPWANRSSLAPEITDWEPEEALFGADEDGLAFYRRLMVQGVKHLKSDGFIVVEIGDGQADAVTKLFLDGGWKRPIVHLDLNGLPRVISASRC